MVKNSLIKQITAELRRYANDQHAKSDKRYHRYPSYKSYGIRAPILARILKQYRRNIKELSCSEALKTTQILFKSGIEEQLLTGNSLLALKNNCLVLPEHASYIDQLANNFMSWSTVDDFCIDVLQPILFKQPKETLILLRKWNKSKNIWKRRASVVAFTRKVGESGQFTTEVIELCDNLKTDSEDLVQKGVGWALKDAMRGDKQKVLAYIKQIRQEGIPATVTLYAIRDLTGKERKEILFLKPPKDLKITTE